MRKKIALFVASIVAVAAVVVLDEGSAPGAVPFPGAAFSGFSTGTNVHADVLRTAATGPVVADVEAAFSGAAIDSTTFDAGVYNEENIAVVPAPGAADAGVDSVDKESFGKGSGVEVGLGTDLPNDDVNQIKLGLAEGGAQPAARSDSEPVESINDTGDVDNSLLTLVEASPLLYLQAAFGHARARWNELQCLTDGNLSEGQGKVADAQLVETGPGDADPQMDAPLVGLHSNFFGDERGVADSRSFTYLVENADGTFGLATETHMTFAPIGLLQTDPNLPPPIFVEILGEWIFRATATGKPGGATVTYEVDGLSESPDPAVIRIYLGPTGPDALPTIEIKRSQLFTPTGINIDIPPGPGPKLLSLTIGEDIRAISAPNVLPDPASQPTTGGNGTLASGAVDVIRISALNANSLDPNGPQVAGIRIGHLEARAQVPPDGISCPPPTTTTTQSPTTSTSTTSTSSSTTSTTTPGATTTTSTTTPGATTTTSTTTPGATTTSTTPPAATTTTIPTVVGGVNISRGSSPPAQPVTAQPRFTG